MITFLFEQYGYYPKDFINNTFFIDGWTFKLIETNYDEKYIEEIDRYCEEIRKIFFYKGPYIIKTRTDKLLSVYDSKNYVLISVRYDNMSIYDLNKLHVSLKQVNKTVDLKKLLFSWDEKVSYIESNSINSIRVDSVHFQKNLEITMFCLGMAQNAIQYLSDCIIDYGENLENTTLTHKRLKNLETLDVLNPFNFVVDHPMRDLIELYQNDFIQFNDLENIVKYYELDTKTATVCMARLLYPCEQLDMLEKNIYSKSASFKMDYNIEKEFMKIKKIYYYFKEKYKIRPINWLEY